MLSVRPLKPDARGLEPVLQDLEAAAAEYWARREAGRRKRSWYERLLGMGNGGSRTLVAREGKLVRGFVTYRAQGARGTLDGLYVDRRVDREATAQLLLHAATSDLRQRDHVRRIDNQFYTWPEDYVTGAFKDTGYRVVSRANMSLYLPSARLPKDPPGHRRVRILPWKSDLRDSLYHLAHECYRNREDAVYLPEEITREGARSRVDELIRNGILPYSSLLAAGDKTIGAAIVSNCHSEPEIQTVAIQELCIAPEYRQQGLASLLLGDVLRRMQQEGERRVVVTVTLSNASSYRVYRSFGFELEQVVPHATWTEE